MNIPMLATGNIQMGWESFVYFKNLANFQGERKEVDESINRLLRFFSKKKKVKID